MTQSRNGGEALARFGYRAALGTAITTLVTFAVAIATPPLSGPFCRKDCIEYPYLDIAARFPRDYYWMFSAIVALPFYLALMVALHERAPSDRRVITRLGLVFAIMAALTLLGDYFVQLSVVQPSVIAGEMDGISLLTQYNPHGLFIALEELGYLLMSLSLVLMVPSLSRSTRLEVAIRWIFVVGFVLMTLAFGWFLLRFSHARAYLFEVAAITIDWSSLTAGAFVASVVFRREMWMLVRERG